MRLVVVEVRWLERTLGPRQPRAARGVPVRALGTRARCVPVITVLVVTRGHWRSIETHRDLEPVICTGRRRDKKLGNRCSIP